MQVTIVLILLSSLNFEKSEQLYFSLKTNVSL